VEILLGAQVCYICTVGFEIGKQNNKTVKCNLHHYTMSECSFLNVRVCSIFDAM